jgi:hypothetical protein
VPHIQLIHLFEAWFYVARRQAARKRMNQTPKAARKHRLQQIFEKANNAERAQDSFQFYQAIRDWHQNNHFREFNCAPTQVTYWVLQHLLMFYVIGTKSSTQQTTCTL